MQRQTERPADRGKGTAGGPRSPATPVPPPRDPRQRHDTSGWPLAECNQDAARVQKKSGPDRPKEVPPEGVPVPPSNEAVWRAAGAGPGDPVGTRVTFGPESHVRLPSVPAGEHPRNGSLNPFSTETSAGPRVRSARGRWVRSARPPGSSGAPVGFVRRAPGRGSVRAVGFVRRPPEVTRNGSVRRPRVRSARAAGFVRRRTVGWPAGSFGASPRVRSGTDGRGSGCQRAAGRREAAHTGISSCRRGPTDLIFRASPSWNVQTVPDFGGEAPGPGDRERGGPGRNGCRDARPRAEGCLSEGAGRPRGAPRHTGTGPVGGVRGARRKERTPLGTRYAAPRPVGMMRRAPPDLPPHGREERTRDDGRSGHLAPLGTGPRCHRPCRSRVAPRVWRSDPRARTDWRVSARWATRPIRR